MSSDLRQLITRRPVLWCLVLAATAAASYLAAEIYLLDGHVGFPLDDSWIHLQFARNLAAGEGLSYNPGELVTGSTAPLWTATLSLVFLLPGSPPVWAKLLGIALYLAIAPATYRFARDLRIGRGLATLAAALTVSTSWVVWSALSSMEIPLFTVLSLVGMSLHVRERGGSGDVPYSVVVLSLAALARPEGLLLVGAAAADRLLAAFVRPQAGDLRRSLRRLALWLALAALILLPTMVFYRVVGGSFLPTTYSAKGADLQRWLPSLAYLRGVVGVFFPVQPVMTLLAGAGVVVLGARVGTREDVGLLPAMWLLGVPLAYSLISPLGHLAVMGNFGRYYFPLFPVVIVLGTLTMDVAWSAAASDDPDSGGVPARRWLAALALAVILLFAAGDLMRGGGRYLRTVGNVEDSDVAMAHWLDGRLPAEAVLAVNDIGALKFLLPNPVIDLAGIGNPEMRDHIDRAQELGLPWQKGVEWFVEERRPDYLVVFPEWYAQMVSNPERFRPLHRIFIEDNVTMGADELVLYSTPWTRYPLQP
jgi:hypothetical protein